MKLKVFITLGLFTLLFFFIALYNLIPVFTRTFPLQNTEAVLFSLTQNVMGAQDFAIHLIQGTIIEALKTTSILTVALSLFALAISFFFKKNGFKFFIFAFFASVLISASISLKRIYNEIPLKEYYQTWSQTLSTPQHSEFYQKEYVDPRQVTITFKEKKNLLLLFLESIEFNYQDFANGGNLKENLIPEITEYMNQYQSFKPGGTWIWGTGWTMADAVAKTCGIPLQFPKGIDGNTFGVYTFLPGAYCLSDILSKEGYATAFSQGANLKFASMKYFLNTHSVSDAYGFQEYQQDKRFRIDTTTIWGIRDSTHYEILKQRISKLDSSSKSWFLWAETIDTHTPYGVLDRECKTKDIPEEQQYPSVIKCTSMQLHRFIEWAKQQSWFSNTTIAIMGDHTTMADLKTVGYTDTSIKRYWLNFFINSTIKPINPNRIFSSLDMYPTILEAMGAEVEGHALGLGRSLYSSEPTLIEKYGLSKLNQHLRKRSIEYDYFLNGK